MKTKTKTQRSRKSLRTQRYEATPWPVKVETDLAQAFARIAGLEANVQSLWEGVNELWEGVHKLQKRGGR